MLKKSPHYFIRMACCIGFVASLTLGLHMSAQPAQSLTLAWNPSADSSVVGYRLHYGTSSGNYTQSLDVINATRATVSNLTAGGRYYFVVTAYNGSGVESLPSNEMFVTAQAVPYGITAVHYLSNGSVQLTVTGSAGLTDSIYASTDMKSWSLLKTAVNTTGTLLVTDTTAATLSRRFYRVKDSTGTSDPAGFTKLAMAGASTALSPSYSYLGISLTNVASYTGKVTSCGVQTITDDSAIWNDNQFNGDLGQFYIEIVSGSHAGLTTDILATNAATKTLTTDDDLSMYLAGGELYKIRRHRTIGDVFGTSDLAGINGGADVSGADEVRVFNPVTQTYLSYYYQNSGTGGVGWRASTSTVADATGARLYLDQGLVICRKVSGDLSLVLTGAVKTGPTVVPIGTNLNLVSNIYPAGTLTLGNSGLYKGSVAQGLAGGSDVSTADEVRISNGTGFRVYYYKNSGLSGTGWRSTASLRTDASKTVIPTGSSIYVLRKNNRPGFNWTVAQPF